MTPTQTTQENKREGRILMDKDNIKFHTQTAQKNNSQPSNALNRKLEKVVPSQDKMADNTPIETAQKNVDKIELWVCKKQIAVPKADYGKDEYQRKILIEVGEVVEFRYHANIHFRTMDNIYCVLDEDTFYDNFKPYGKIWDNVKFRNRCELKDILEHYLYEKYEGEDEDE